MNSDGFARITAESKQRLILYSPKSSSHPAVRLDGEALCRHCYRFIPATATGETTNAIRLAGYQIASGTISPCQNHLTFKALLLSVKFHCLCPPTNLIPDADVSTSFACPWLLAFRRGGGAERSNFKKNLFVLKTTGGF